MKLLAFSGGEKIGLKTVAGLKNVSKQGWHVN
jgi:hypothetical protein